SPNRTFLVDYEVDVDPTVDNGGADDIRFQVQVHERSNIINVRYRESGNLANGQGTTIGFQGAGGASGTARPLTCNGKVLDDIRYGTVGSSPNRTFIVDFQENRVAATGDKVNGQVQIHERSNLLNVKYRSTMSPGANGQTATIGFQGAGGSSAVAYPLTFNGKI